jgi:hypothetical protein
MRKQSILKLTFATSLALFALESSNLPAHSHAGKLNKHGCHKDRRHGGYHCHHGGGQSVDESDSDYEQDSTPEAATSTGTRSQPLTAWATPDASTVGRLNLAGRVIGAYIEAGTLPAGIASAADLVTLVTAANLAAAQAAAPAEGYTDEHEELAGTVPCEPAAPRQQIAYVQLWLMGFEPPGLESHADGIAGPKTRSAVIWLTNKLKVDPSPLLVCVGQKEEESANP